LKIAAKTNTWNQILNRVQSKVNAHSFNTWFKPTRFMSEDDSNLTVRVPNSWFAEWLKTNYNSIIQTVLNDLKRPGLTVRYLPESSVAIRKTSHRRPGTHKQVAAGPGAEARAIPTGTPKFNQRYTFDKFVVSSCNQFAHAAAMAVAEKPTHNYNPLYIYGGVGLGKTHLMQAIGNLVSLKNPSAKMAYVSSETFMNELINAIRFEKSLEFKEKYRNIDLLLIDDIQFLAGKERTQEEFFHTFNALHDSNKQIVLTSDVPPKEIPTLEERLRSRFEWGLIADIQPPDLETKIAIIRKKAEEEQVNIPDDVALLIASNCNSNIRELEGALIRVIAYSSMTGRNLDHDLARETLAELVIPDSPAVTVDQIQRIVCNYYNLKGNEIKSKNNSQRIAFPRQVAMYLCKQMTDCSLPEIGRHFGGKHHSTVIHAIQKIDIRKKKDPEFERLLTSFEEKLH
jgi:chromosomal replication initiator protein